MSAERISRDSAKSAFTGGRVDHNEPKLSNDYTLFQYTQRKRVL